MIYDCIGIQVEDRRKIYNLSNPNMGKSVALCITWWRHQIETFSALLALCDGNSPVTAEFPLQRPVTRSFGVFFDLHMNILLSKKIETPVIGDAIPPIMIIAMQNPDYNTVLPEARQHTSIYVLKKRASRTNNEWVSEWARERASERVSEWVSEWVSEEKFHLNIENDRAKIFSYCTALLWLEFNAAPWLVSYICMYIYL